MALSKGERAIVREMFGGKCAYCGHHLGVRWHADHFKPLMRKITWVRDANGRTIYTNGRPKTKLVGAWNPENERSDNYFPSCVPCNIDKSCMTIEEWRRSLQDKVGVALRSSTPLRHALRFGMIHVEEKPIVFYFERYMQEAA